MDHRRYRHCGRDKANRPRGLCWTCYSLPGIRDQYAVHPLLGRRGVGLANSNIPPPGPTVAWPGSPAKMVALEERAAANVGLWHRGDLNLASRTTDNEEVFDMARHDHEGGFHVVGYLPAKPPIIIASCPTEPAAIETAKRCAASLDDYTQITVEIAKPGGKTGTNSAQWNGPDIRVLHRFDGLAAKRADEPVATGVPREIAGFPWLGRQGGTKTESEAPMSETPKPKLCKHNLTLGECADCARGIQTLKERHQMRTSETTARPLPTPGQTMGQANGARLDPLKTLVQEMGRDAAVADVLAEAERRGLGKFTAQNVYYLRSKVGLAGKPGPKLKVTAAGPTNGTPASTDKSWKVMNRLEKTNLVRALVRELDPDLTASEVIAEGERCGMTGIALATVWRARKDAGQKHPSAKPGRKPKQPSAPARSATPATTPAGDDDSPIMTVEDLKLFTAAVKRIGGAEIARQVLEVIAG